MKSKASRSDLKTLTLTLAMPNDDDDDNDFQNSSQVIAIMQNRILFSLQNPNGAPPPRKKQNHRFQWEGESKSLKQQNQHQNMGNCNGDVSHSVIEMAVEALLKASKSTESITDDIDGKSKPPVVQQKGSFKVTSEKVDLEKISMLQRDYALSTMRQLCTGE